MKTLGVFSSIVLSVTIAISSVTPAFAADTVSVASWNVLSKNSDANIVAGTKNLTKSSDVIGLQETSGRKSTRPAIVAGVKATHVMPITKNAVPILARHTKFKVVSSGSIRAYEETKGEPDNTGSTKIGVKNITWVLLEQKVGIKNRVYVVNTHLLNYTNKKGVPMADKPTRVKYYKIQLAKSIELAQKFKSSGVPTVVTGDFNIDYSDDKAVQSHMSPYKQMAAAGFKANWEYLGEQPTHGNSTIDYVWSKGLQPVSHSVGANKYGSDHAQVQVKFNFVPIT